MIYGTRSSRTMLGGPATLTNPAVAARVRQLAAQAGHRRAIAEFRARRAAGSRPALTPCSSKPSPRSPATGVPGHHPAAQPQIDTSTCQNMNTECCRIMCRQRGR